MTTTPDPDEVLAEAVRTWWAARMTAEDDSPALLRSFHLVAEGLAVDDDGDACTRVRCSTDGSVVQQLGLIDYARNLLTARVFGRIGS